MNSGVEGWLGLAIALGAGLLIGIERERRKGAGRTRAFAGVRTFAIASLTGALSTLFGSVFVSVAALAGVSALAVVSHLRDTSDDPGATTEIALIATTLIGMLSMSTPALAAAAATALAGLLLLRASVQRFAVTVLSEREFTDAVILLSLGLILLPLLPDRDLSTTIQVNPNRLLRLVLIMSAIQAFGYVMLRMFGQRAGVSLAGLMSGFVSSTATHAAMGARARANPESSRAYMSAAVFSNVATGVQAMVIVLATSPARFASLVPYLATMIVAAAVCGGLAFRRIENVQTKSEDRAFSLWQAFLFAVLLTSVSGLSLWANRQWGEAAGWAAAMFAATVDVHVAIASLISQANTTNDSLVVPLLLCLLVNAFAKTVATFASAGLSRYSVEVGVCLAIIAGAPWVLHFLWRS